MSQSTATENGEFLCTFGCGRRFDTDKKRRMHQVRMHTHKKVGDEAGKAGRTAHADQSREAVLARKKAYNKVYRARLARGLPGAHRRIDQSAKAQEKRKFYLRQKARFAALGLNSHGQPYKIANPNARLNIQRAQTARRQRERQEKLGILARVGRGTTNRRIHYVFPPTGENDDAFNDHTSTAAEMEPTGSMPLTPHFCPKCGEDQTRWKRS